MQAPKKLKPTPRALYYVVQLKALLYLPAHLNTTSCLGTYLLIQPEAGKRGPPPILLDSSTLCRYYVVQPSSPPTAQRHPIESLSGLGLFSFAHQ